MPWRASSLIGLVALGGSSLPAGSLPAGAYPRARAPCAFLACVSCRACSALCKGLRHSKGGSPDDRWQQCGADGYRTEPRDEPKGRDERARGRGARRQSACTINANRRGTGGCTSSQGPRLRSASELVLGEDGPDHGLRGVVHRDGGAARQVQVQQLRQQRLGLLSQRPASVRNPSYVSKRRGTHAAGWTPWSSAPPQPLAHLRPKLPRHESVSMPGVAAMDR